MAHLIKVLPIKTRFDAEPPSFFQKTLIMSNLIFSRQIDNFNSLVVLANSYGDRYAPKQVYLSVTKLQERVTAFRELHEAMAERDSLHQSIRASRSKLVKEALANAKRIRWSLENMLPANDNRIQRLKVLFREINGNTNRDQKPEEKPSRSNSQKSFTDRLDQFIRLKGILADTQEYVPESDELKATQWSLMLDDLYVFREDCQEAEAQDELDRELRKKAQKEIAQLNRAIKRYMKIALLEVSTI